MTTATPDSIRQSIADYPDPETGRGIESMGQILDIRVDDHDARITIALASHSMPIAEERASIFSIPLRASASALPELATPIAWAMSE